MNLLSSDAVELSYTAAREILENIVDAIHLAQSKELIGVRHCITVFPFAEGTGGNGNSIFV